MTTTTVTHWGLRHVKPRINVSFVCFILYFTTLTTIYYPSTQWRQENRLSKDGLLYRDLRRVEPRINISSACFLLHFTRLTTFTSLLRDNQWHHRVSSRCISPCYWYVLYVLFYIKITNYILFTSLLCDNDKKTDKQCWIYCVTTVTMQQHDVPIHAPQTTGWGDE